MSDDIEDLGDEELVREYQSVVEFRHEESLNGQVSPKQINLRKALEQELLSRMVSDTSKKSDIYEYIRENPDCSYSDVLESVGETGKTIDALAELKQAGEIYEPQQGRLRVTEE